MDGQLRASHNNNSQEQWSFSRDLGDGQINPSELQNPFGSDIEPQRPSQKNLQQDKSISGIHHAKNPGTMGALENDPDIENILNQIGNPNQRHSTKNSGPIDPKHDPWIKWQPKEPIEYSGQKKKAREFNPIVPKFISGYPPNSVPKDFVDFPGTLTQDTNYHQFDTQTPHINPYNKVMGGFDSVQVSPKEAAMEYERLQDEYCTSPYPVLNVIVVILFNLGCFGVLLSTGRIEKNEGKLCLITSCLKLNLELGLYKYTLLVGILFSQFICLMGLSAYKNRNLFGLIWLFTAYVLIIVCSLFKEINEVSFLFGMVALSIGRVALRLFKMEKLKAIIGDYMQELEYQEAKKAVEIEDDDWRVYNVFWTRKVSKTCQTSALWSGLIDISILCGVTLILFLLFRLHRLF